MNRYLRAVKNGREKVPVAARSGASARAAVQKNTCRNFRQMAEFAYKTDRLLTKHTFFMSKYWAEALSFRR
jgi:hypothetical protein